MATMSVNGITVTGNSISVVNGKVIVDGIEISGNFSGNVELKITEGIVQNIRTDRSVNCGAVGGNVDAGGSVNCDDVRGSVNAGGSVNCDDIGGDVRAGGSIHRS